MHSSDYLYELCWPKRIRWIPMKVLGNGGVLMNRTLPSPEKSSYRHLGLDWRKDATANSNPYFFWVPSQTLQNRCPQRSQTAVNFRVRFLHLQHFRLTESSIHRCSVYHRETWRSQFARIPFHRTWPCGFRTGCQVRCLSLQLRHWCVQGTAFNRALEIRCPQVTQTPYVFCFTRTNASSIARRRGPSV